MSYGPPPKTSYGDQDFIKEDWNQQQTPPSLTGISPSPPTNLGAYGGPSASQSLPPQSGNYGNSNVATSQPQVFDARSFAEVAKSLTQDDILFTRSWRQDSFYYRVVPLTAVGLGAYYYFNKMKSLPQKPSRFVLVAGACYALGKWSYRGELRRRLETSPLQTPYMQALRSALGVKSVAASGFVGETSQDAMYGDSFESNQTSFPPAQRGPFAEPFKQPVSSDYSQYNPGSTELSSNYPSSNLYDSNSEFPNKPTTSYDELRARNRGFVPK